MKFSTWGLFGVIGVAGARTTLPVLAPPPVGTRFIPTIPDAFPLPRLHADNHSFLRRADIEPADDETFKKAVCKGTKLLKQMRATDKLAGQILDKPLDTIQSKFHQKSELVEWGYGELEYDPYYDFNTALPIKTALEGLGVSSKKKDEGGNNHAFLWEHEVETEHNGKKYPITGASFTSVFNPVDGVIVAWGSFGPAYMAAKQKPPVTVLPDLKSWSDIIFLQWQDLGSPRSLKYVFRAPIENAATHSLVLRALKNADKELGKWPGFTFDIKSDEGRALLGSPNGAGVAFLLAQHKEQLGNKVVERVTIFQDEGKKVPRPPSLVFYIEEATAIDNNEELDKLFGRD